jgi:hypothetical protein
LAKKKSQKPPINIDGWTDYNPLQFHSIATGTKNEF